MKFAVLDLKSSPPCIVLVTDDATEAEETAQRYANQTGYGVELADVAASEIIDPSKRTLIGSPRLLVAEDFATPADARRAGFNVADEPLKLTEGDTTPKNASGHPFNVPSSRDEGEATSVDVAKKKPTK